MNTMVTIIGGIFKKIFQKIKDVLVFAKVTQ